MKIRPARKAHYQATLIIFPFALITFAILLLVGWPSSWGSFYLVAVPFLIVWLFVIARTTNWLEKRSITQRQNSEAR